MSDLQLSLLVLGAVLVAAVAGYNAFVERRARRRAEASFQASHADALMEPGEKRREPSLGVLLADHGRPDPQLGALDAVMSAPAERTEAPAADPGGSLSPTVDTVALVLADGPVTREQVEPLLDALQSHATPVNVEGLVGEQWVPIEDATREHWRELRVGLQLASRAGPVAEEEIAAFNDSVAAFAASVNAISQRESPAEAARRARELDAFCAEVDVEVAVNLVGRSGATFALPRVRSLALEQGFAETGSGDFQRRAPDGSVEMSVRALDGEPRREAGYVTGLTFAIDVPHVVDPAAVLGEVGRVAEAFAAELGGELVDDARRPLGSGGLAAIRRSLEAVAGKMQAHGVPAGSALARRLFS